VGVLALPFLSCQLLLQTRKGDSTHEVVELVKSIKQTTGFTEVGLLSLSTFDYSKLSEVVDLLSGEHLSMSLPSLRLDSLDTDLLKKWIQLDI